MSTSPDASHSDASRPEPASERAVPAPSVPDQPAPEAAGSGSLAARSLGTQPPRAAVRRFADAAPLRRLQPPPAPPWGSPPGPLQPPVPPAPDATQAAADRAERHQVASVVRMVAQAVFEALSGARPVHQLARWLDLENFEKLRLRVELTRAARPARSAGARGPVVRRTRVCRVAEGSYEAAVVVAEPERVRAAALRIERRRGQWRVCALEIG
ncbi:hypothetical protein NCCP1664_28480 [Zafaria cholistanensis]|uniref:Uncharacterized protein n=1 Tax=Zafaria cholistanensis TaxID=1682741 RepID=A0A5A7NU77_9MICC|nr:Rv3235 family protein [Zafaria cholistanensis]GER24353.1 hypothetical protein NCCP1664_28480 [Zafaria cholistanensis]